MKVEWKTSGHSPVRLSALPTGAVFRFADDHGDEPRVCVCVEFPNGTGFGYLDLESGITSRRRLSDAVVALDARLVVDGEL